jgi:hypothetical protein
MNPVIFEPIELKTGISIKRFVTQCKKVMDARMPDGLTQKEILVKGKFTETIRLILKNLSIPQ